MDEGASLEGVPFSRLYIRPEEPQSDNPRMRYRIGVRINSVFNQYGNVVAFGRFLESELGVPVLRFVISESPTPDWRRFTKFCDVQDVLDTVTLLWKYLSGVNKKHELADEFRHGVGRIFAELGMRYTVDAQCGVHPFIDKGFEWLRVSTIKGLEAKGLVSAKGELEHMEEAMLREEFDGLQAIRHAFFAAENVFKVAFGGNVLSKSRVMNELGPELDRNIPAGGGDRRAAGQQLAGLAAWVVAAHNYRHEPGSPEPSQPPRALAEHMISSGLAHVRWLATFVPVDKGHGS